MTRLTSQRLIAAVALVAVISAVGCADRRHGGMTAPSTAGEDSVAALLESSAVGAERVDAFCRLARADGWRDSLRLYEMSEAEFAALPESERQALFEKNLARAGVARSLIEDAIAQITGARAIGDTDRAEMIAACLRRFADANRGPRALALATLYAELIDRRLAEIGA